MDETADVPGRHPVAGSRLRVFCAVVYVAGVALLLVGAGGAFMWAPLLWCAAVGFVAITVAFAISGGRL